MFNPRSVLGGGSIAKISGSHLLGGGPARAKALGLECPAENSQKGGQPAAAE